MKKEQDIMEIEQADLKGISKNENNVEFLQ